MTDKKKTTDKAQADTYNTLWQLTGHKAGGILFPDNSVWVGNWSYGTPVEIIPPGFSASEVDDAPQRVVRAMIQHDLDNGGWGPEQGYHAWAIHSPHYPDGHLFVVIQDDWN